MPHPGSLLLPFNKICQASLTQIRFLSKWDFYCSKGADSKILLLQSFPVSYRRGSAAMLQFSLPQLLWANLGRWLQKPLLVSAKSWFQRMKQFLKKRYRPSLICITCTMHSQTSNSMCMLHFNVRVWSPASHNWNVPMVPQHVGSLLSQEKWFYVVGI